ncbi:VWA domain-containing protein [Mangrovimonas sp. YM274]|uniref:VWA domain-containing protein n=1 Tax=Mangrovimonas sp. YM274 TaxID=3070660 RepID=UPI0027DE677B|nr:VWA domain-containing protein [Mangrovimonas sp. YM274]WMI67293.1 VWA domain-containing protein [Mangrovimonas sp. YM274]
MNDITLLYIIIAGIIALLVALFQYIYKSKKRTKTNMLLAFLRFVTVFTVLLLLINPKFEKISYYNEKPNLVVAVDNSESIDYLQQSNNVEDIISAIKSEETINSNFNVEYYTFGKQLQALDSLSFREKQSDMSKAFKRLSEVYNNTIAPTILITDGNQTYGNDYEYVTNRLYKQPIYPIVLGDTTKYTDLKIQQLNVNKYAYLKNKFPVEIIAVYDGDSQVNTQLKITSGNTVIHSQNLEFDEQNTSRIIDVTLPANRVGVTNYKAELTPLEGEKNKVNNVKNFAVEVIDQKTNVAIISDLIHPDLGALKKAIESNEQRSASILSIRDFLISSTDFQSVILYQPNNSFNLVYNELEKRKLNSFVVLGPKTNWTFLNNIQSLYQQKITRQTEDFLPALNPNYATFIVDDLGFHDFPPLQSEFGSLTFSIPMDPILFKTINGTQLDEPLLATFENGNQRQAVLVGEGIWRWRAQSFLEAQSFQEFDDFIGKLIQYLSTNQRKNRLNVDYESFYNGNDDLKITAQFFNKNYEFDNNASINISLKNQDTDNVLSFPFVLKNTNYEVDLSGLTPGRYRFTVSVDSENISTQGELQVLDYNVEQQFLNANVAKLNNVASASKGKVFFRNQLQDLATLLLNDSRYQTLQKSTKKIVPLIDWKYLLGLIVLSLSLEWFIRKYKGLI